MFKYGDLIYFDELIFNDGKKDFKTNRPCVVIYCSESDNKVICMPLTTALDTRNKNKGNYLIVTTILYSFRRLSFINMNNIITKKIKEAHDYKASLNDVDKENLIKKIKEKADNNERFKYIDMLIDDDMKKKKLILNN